MVSHRGWGGPVRNQRPGPQSLEASRPLRNSGPRGSERWRWASQLPSSLLPPWWAVRRGSHGTLKVFKMQEPQGGLCLSVVLDAPLQRDSQGTECILAARD